MAQFPIVLIPDAIQKTRTALPSVPPPNLSVPVHPGNPPKKIDMISIGIQSAISIILSFIVGNLVDSSLLGTLLLIGSSSAIAFRTWQGINNYPERKKEHREKVSAQFINDNMSAVFFVQENLR